MLDDVRHTLGAAIVAIVLSSSTLAQVPAPRSTTGAAGAAPQSVQLFVGEAKDVALGGAVGSLVVVDPAPLTAEVVGGSGVRLTGVALGETLVIATTPRGRVTLDVEVVGRPPKPVVDHSVEEAAIAQNPISGFYTLAYTPALTGTHAAVAQRFEYRQKLGAGRTLLVSGDVLRFFDRAADGPPGARAPSFGFNRVSLGIASAAGTLDVLDSTLEVSPLSISGYTMRGPHLVAAPGSALAGLDIFAGLASPVFGSFGAGQGRVVGALVPVAHTDAWRLRAGAIAISPSERNPASLRTGGTILQMDALFTPSKDTRFFGELEYSNGGISGGAQLNLHRTAYDLSAGFSRLDRRSPLTSIGAQGAGRTLLSGTFLWHPGGRYSAFASYTRSVRTAVQPAGPELITRPDAASAPAALADETLQLSATVNLTPGSQLGVQLTNQRLDVVTDGASTPFRLDTRTYGVSYTTRFAERWSNQLEASVSSSREAGGAGVKRSLDIREDLQHSWARGSASAFFRYTNASESLVGLVIRNPSILPPELRAEYDAEPARFLAAHSDLLRSLFPGVALPYRRSTELGLRFQNTYSRLNLSSETSYRASGSGLGDEGASLNRLAPQYGSTRRTISS